MRVVDLSAFYLFLFYVYRCACLHACLAPRVCSAPGGGAEEGIVLLGTGITHLCETTY